MVGEAFRGSLGGVSHHHNSHFAGLRVGTRIGERFGVDSFVGVLIARLGIEISSQSVAVVLNDEVLDGLRQLSLVGKFDAVGNVAYHNRRALFGREHIVRIHTSLILGEEIRALGFADIVIDGAHTHQLHIGTNQVSRLGSQICHLHRVLECARTEVGELTQQRLIEVGELHQRERRGESKQLLKHIYEQIAERQQDGIDYKIEEHIFADAVNSAFLHHKEGYVNHAIAHKHHDGGAGKLRAARHLLYGGNRDDAYGKLHEHKVGGIGRHYRCQHHLHHVHHNCQTRIEEGGHDNGHKRKRHDVSRLHRVETDAKEEQCGEAGEQRHHKREFAHIKEHMRAEHGKIDVEHEHEYGDNRHTAEDVIVRFLLAHIVGFVFLLHIVERRHHLRCNHVAAVDDALAFLYDSHRSKLLLQTHPEQVHRPYRIHHHIGLQIGVEMQRGKFVAQIMLGSQRVEMLISRTHREETVG